MPVKKCTIRILKTSETLGREVTLSKVFKRILLKTPVYDLFLSKNDLSEILITPQDPWPGDPAIGEKILQGDLNLSSKKSRLMPQRLLWQINNKEFWNEEIHTFSWLRHLKARSGPLARKHARKLIMDWLNRNNKWNEKVHDPLH